MTLMELMIVMVIIAVLVALMVPATLKLRAHATTTKERSARLTLRNAILSYHAHYEKWPVGDQVNKEEFRSRDVITKLRENADNKIFWEGEDWIKSSSGQEYVVVINPFGTYPVKQDDALWTPQNVGPASYKVYFLLK